MVWRGPVFSVAVLAWIVALGCTSLASPYDDWREWSDPAAGFALWLPPTHDVAASGKIWYVHGFLDGEPTVPDMSISFRSGVSLDAALAEVSEDALVEWVALGAGTPGRRVTARYAGIHGSYVSSWYLVPGTGGTFVIRGWEDLFWELFHHVAITFEVLGR